MTEPVIGQTVPDFSAASTQGEFHFGDLRGQRHLVLYFYPKDNTPGCTTEAQDFRDHHADFQAAGATIIGVSRDTLRSHEGFAKRHTLPFALVSDTDETLCQLFDVIRIKNRYGKQVRGIERSTFLLDKHGTLVRAWRNLRVAGHVDEVLQAVRDLG